MIRKRLRKEGKDGGGGAYFSSPSTSHEFISSGCKVLDCVLGGGYVLGRVSNIIGDKSTGKSLLAMEAAANFFLRYPKGIVWYREAEAAFDDSYAQALGIPMQRIDKKQDLDTVEDMFEDLSSILRRESKNPGLYILDSLDSLSDEAEMKRGIREGSYGGTKPKKMGELFRRLVRQLGKARICVMIISQVRDNIGVMFGERHTRTGGKAMDFYASHCLWLAHMKVIPRTVNKVQRPIGVRIKAKCKKNKIGMPFRECEFNIRFGYGIDDITASLEWLEEVGHLPELELTAGDISKITRTVETMSIEEATALRADIDEVVQKVWSQVETTFLPRSRKYD